MLGILCAFACLVLTALNDFIFKLFARKERSKGLFVSIIGVFWLFTLLPLPHGEKMNWTSTILWGSISGFFSAGGNILLIEGMSRQSAGLCSLIYRLNMVPVIIGASLILGQTTGPLQYAGIACAIGAILLFQWGNSSSTPAGKAGEPSGTSGRKMVSLGIILVVIAAFMRAGMGLSYEYGFDHGADKNAVAQLNSLFWIIGGIIYAFTKEFKILKNSDKKLLGYGALSGVLVAGIVVFMAWSLAYGDAVIVLPIAQMGFILTFLLGVVFLKEPFRKKHIAALLCAIAAVILLATPR